MREFGLSQSAAAEVARTVAEYLAKSISASASVRESRRSKIPNIAGTLRIEDLILSGADRKFLDFVLDLGLTETDSVAIIADFAQAKRNTKRLADAPAE